MNEVIINATGRDFMRLWYFRDGKLSFRKYKNRSWIFVSGTEYDLDILSRQLDETDLYSYQESTRSNVYGPMKGLEISVNPSKMQDILFAIENIGYGRKFSIFNADINPPLRFMSERHLHFFQTGSPEDFDPEIPSVYIGGRTSLGTPVEVRINERRYRDINSDLLSDLSFAIKDSVIVVYENRDRLFEKLMRLMVTHGYDIGLSRNRSGTTYESYGQIYYSNPRINISGKIAIEADSFTYSEAGLPGLMEMSRISSLPIVSASTVTAGTAVSSMEESFAIRNNVLIPLYKDDHEHAKSSDVLMDTDKGGMVLQPEPGIYEDVYEIDFSSMYPSIMVNYNLSPETIGLDGDFQVPGLPYSIKNSSRGFLSMALENLLRTRLFYKSIKSRNKVYEQRDAALKWMLLTSFGYTGYKNAKFGKIEVHESITAIGRWALSRAISLAMKHGFEPIHGIVDSLWIKGNGDIDALLEEIERETRIGIVLDGHYRWIAFMPARSGLGALNRYVGLRYDGTFKVRGIEIRRSDVPQICVDFQMDALNILRRCGNPEEIWEKRGEIKIFENAYMKELPLKPRENFRMGIHVTRNREEYRVNNIQKKLLEISENIGYHVNVGDRIGAIIVNKRNGTIDLGDQHDGIDIEFYRKILERSFEPIDFIVSSCAPKKRRTTLYTLSQDWK